MMSIRGCCSGDIFKGRVLFLKEKLFRPFAIDSRPLGGSVVSRMLVSTLSGNSAFFQHNHNKCQHNTSNYYYHHQHHHRSFFVSSSPRGSMLLLSLSPPPSFSRTLFQNHPPQNYYHKGAPKREASSINHDNEVNEKNNTNPLLLSFSSISETPLDSTVMEKPYTLILMEDDVSALFSTHGNGNSCNADYGDTTFGSSEHQSNNGTTITTSAESWIELFRSKIPRDYGMSFASVSLQMQRDKNNNNVDGGNNRRLASISDGLQSLKASQLPGFSDAILVARGPVSSLIAQYYLESFSLKGLVMIDPILLDDSDDENSDLSLLVSSIYRDSDDDDSDSIERFRSNRLLVEPNAVPMMVIRTVRDDHPVLESSARFVAQRHGAPNGPYGTVPFADLIHDENGNETSNDNVANALLHRINEWIEGTL